jgi:DNA polymerase family A
VLEALPYRSVVVADFEFEFGDNFGNRPRPVCMVAKELRSGETWRVWRGEFGSTPPFPIGPDALFVAYYASAELGCFRALGWPMPARILDLYVEFRARTNGLNPAGRGLIDALAHFGLDAIGAVEKDRMRALILRGPPWSDAEREEIIDYCEIGDVLPLERLLPAMLPKIDLRRALLRGRYMAAESAKERAGIPIDPLLGRLIKHWSDIQDGLITAIDKDYGVYEGRSFRKHLFAAFLNRHDIPWPLHPDGALDLRDDTFGEMAKGYPILAPLRQLRQTLSSLRLQDLQVGDDGRNRTVLGAFGSKTGRDQPSNAKFIFGPSTWLRGLIKPPPGYAVAYIDWSNQELAIAAKLSGDQRLIEAYLTGDPYIAFGIQCGKLPAGATEASHPDERQLFKQCVLGTLFSMGTKTLAFKIGQSELVARELLHLHRATYKKYWSWSEAAVDYAMLHGTINTAFGWPLHVDQNTKPGSLINFPMQANGAEMQRIASCLATERGIEVCASVHDAFLICAPVEKIGGQAAAMQAAMDEASRLVLDGFTLRTEAKTVCFPHRYMDPRGAVMWGRIMQLLAQIENQKNEAA